MGIIFKPDTIVMRDSIKSKVLGGEGVGFGEGRRLFLQKGSPPLPNSFIYPMTR